MEDEAFARNEAFDKNARKEAREAQLEAAKAKVRKTGRAALNGVKSAGLVTVGLGVVAKDAALNFVDNRRHEKASKRAARAEKKASAVRAKQNRINVRRNKKQARRDAPRNRKIAEAQRKQQLANRKAQAARARVDSRRA
jgi:hypothetical protein